MEASARAPTASESRASGHAQVAAQLPHSAASRPNGWRLSGEGGEADRVRCSRGLGRRALASWAFEKGVCPNRLDTVTAELAVMWSEKALYGPAKQTAPSEDVANANW